MVAVDNRPKVFKKEPIPADLQTKPIDISDNARTVLQKRYLRKNEDGSFAETEQEMFWRVAYHVAKAEADYGADDDTVEVWARRYFDLLTDLRFFPNSPTFTGAGTPLGQLAACFVLGIDDDMGRTGSGIFETLRHAALIQQTGGGNGFSFSRLRPRGANVATSNGAATGPVGFMRVYDQAFGEIAQGGSRRGANMGVLRVDHPDIEEFIQCKSVEGAIENFNISVGITDTFMQAVKNDTDFDLVNPQTGEATRTVRARELFDMIVEYAHSNGEPGVLFLDAANRQNPVPHLYELESTNPCGEQWLGPFENCCLGSVNLAQHYTPDGKVDWDKLQESIDLSTRFLDHVVTANAYVPAIPQLREAAERVRRIGLGIMGLGDLMYATGVRYGSREGQEFASQIMEFVRYHTMQTSIQLAQEKHPFPAIKGSMYDADNLLWEIPTPIVEHVSDWNRPALDWYSLRDDLLEYGIRNGAQLTTAPTGTIATVSGCEGYGCEPVFALAYMRYVVNNAGNSNDRDTLQYTSPFFQHALEKSGLSEDAITAIVEQVNNEGTCQNIMDVPDEIRRVFVVAGDISADEHVRMQGALQAWVDNAISKTVNFPAEATREDVATAYQLGWELGCKGMTVYVTGSRDKVVLETKKTLEEKQQPETASDVPAEAPKMEQAPLFNEEKKPRPSMLAGKTYRIQTPAGTSFVTINENGYGEGQPFEVFMHTAKAGSEVMAIGESLGRLISYVLRIASPVPPRKRLKEIIRQLEGIGGVNTIGFGPNRVRSLPDGVAQILEAYLEQSSHVEDNIDPRDHQSQQTVLPLLEKTTTTKASSKKAMGDICPSCGAATLIFEEGCQKCYSCGYSKC